MAASPGRVGRVREFRFVLIGLALWRGRGLRRTLGRWIRDKGLGTSTRKRVEAIGTIRSMDVSVPMKRVCVDGRLDRGRWRGRIQTWR